MEHYIGPGGGSGGTPPIPSFLSNNHLSAIYEALSKAQGEFRTPKLNRTAEVKKDGKRLYETHYADLQECIDCIKEPLKKNGLSFVQLAEHRDGIWCLVLRLCHSTGQSIESSFPLNFQQAPQQVGGNLTYFKRYQLAAFFGLAAAFDDDGNATASEGDQFNFSQKQKPTTTAGRVHAPPTNHAPQFADPGKFVCDIGRKYKGKKVEDIDKTELGQYIEWLEGQAEQTNKPLQGAAFEFVKHAKDFLSKF